MKNKPRQRCILIIRSGCALRNSVIEAITKNLELARVFESSQWDNWKNNLESEDFDFVFNFLSDKILKGSILSRNSVNFHPGTPEYPGVGTASIALYEGTKTFGATAHQMADTPDTGSIFLVDRFDVDVNTTCEELSSQSEISCLKLLGEIVQHIANFGELPKPNGQSWKRRPITRREFEEFLILDPKNRETFERKIQCTRHSVYPGPFVLIHGRRFSLFEES
jgi:methionyl-tRNA formyltransferase